MITKTLSILDYSRAFSLPMTVLSWLVIFSYSVINSGNVKYGLIAFVGICFAHLATNLLDDYFDYKYLIKRVDFDKIEYLKNTQKTKCRYLISGMFSEKQLLTTVVFYGFIAVTCGLYLFTKCGIGTLYFMLAGVFFVLLYPFLSRICLSEFSVGLAYGPALFGGVYYVMTGLYSNEVFILSVPTMIMTVVLLYVHTVMDYEYDVNEGKKTIANLFVNPKNSLIILKFLFVLAYLSLIVLCVFDILDWQVFFAYTTIPLAVDLYKSLKLFLEDKALVPDKRWYHFPMENFEKFKERNEESFMMRMLQARNLMVYFSLLLTLAIILGLAI